MKKLFRYRGEPMYSFYARLFGEFLADFVIWMTALVLVGIIVGEIVRAI